MKTHTAYWHFNTPTRQQLIHLTTTVQQEVTKSGVLDGLCYVGAMHTSAAVIITDNEEGHLQDIKNLVEQLVPWDNDYEHHGTGDDNGAAHLRNVLLHPQVVVPVTNGKLDLGTWQQIFYAEFDGQRKKRVMCKVIGQ